MRKAIHRPRIWSLDTKAKRRSRAAGIGIRRIRAGRQVSSVQYVEYSPDRPPNTLPLRASRKTRAQALAIINAQVDAAIKMLRSAASKLGQGGRSAATRQTFRKIFRVTPEFKPPWAEADHSDQGSWRRRRRSVTSA